jgi:hypothetical protein
MCVTASDVVARRSFPHVSANGLRGTAAPRGTHTGREVDAVRELWGEFENVLRANSASWEPLRADGE